MARLNLVMGQRLTDSLTGSDDGYRSQQSQDSKVGFEDPEMRANNPKAGFAQKGESDSESTEFEDNEPTVERELPNFRLEEDSPEPRKRTEDWVASINDSIKKEKAKDLIKTLTPILANASKKLLEEPHEEKWGQLIHEVFKQSLIDAEEEAQELFDICETTMVCQDTPKASTITSSYAKETRVTDIPADVSSISNEANLSLSECLSNDSMVELQCNREAKLDFSYNSHFSVCHLTTAIRQAKAIHQLILRQCELTDDRFLEIVRAICDMPEQMDRLDISGNTGLGDKSAHGIARLIRTKSVKNIIAKDCGLHEHHDAVILPALKETPQNNGMKIKYSSADLKVTVDEKGGEIHVKPKRYSISVPPGAVKVQTELTFKSTPPKGKFPLGLVPVSPILRCSPPGQKFFCPVKIRLPVWIRPNPKSAGINLVILTRKYKKARWQRQGLAPCGKDGYVEIDINHFSDVAAASTEGNLNRIIGDYCHMLFINEQESGNDSIQVISWFAPDDRDVITSIKNDMEDDGAKPFGGGGSPLAIRGADLFEDSLQVLDDAHVEISPESREFEGRMILASNKGRRFVYQVDRGELRGDDEERRTKLRHVLSINGQEYQSMELRLRWRSRNETRTATVVNRIGQYYAISGSVVWGVGDQIASTPLPNQPQAAHPREEIQQAVVPGQDQAQQPNRDAHPA